MTQTEYSYREDRRARHASLRDRWLFRKLPGGISIQVTILLLLCLAVIEIVGWFFWDSSGKENLQKQIESSVTEQIVSIVELWQRMPDEYRSEFVQSLNSPLFRVVDSEQPVAMNDLPDWIQDISQDHMPQALQRLEGRNIRFGIIDTKNNSIFDDSETWRSIPVAWRIWLGIEVETARGDYLLFAVPPDEDIWNLGNDWNWGWVATWILVIAFMVWMAHRLTRPVRRLAAAADRLGVDVDAPPLPERGSYELRRATRAFNQMQERLQRFVKDRTQMIAAISHDLRTTLTRLRLRAEFIEDDEQKAKALDDLNEMEHMLSATLSFSRDDNASEPRTKLDLVPMLETMCNDFEDLGKQATFSGPERLAIEGRPIALKRAFGNLMENAVNYGGTVEVSISATASDVHIDFRDHGPGIPDDQKEEVFSAFYRLETSRNRETGGTGLGLAVARSVIRAHGGDVVLIDAPGGGLIARVSLPKVQSA